MTIPAGQPSSTQSTGNGVTDTFPYQFKITAETDLLVTTTNVSVPPIDTVLTLGIDYTVSGVGDNNGGNILLLAGPLADQWKITLADNVPASQDTSYANQSQFFGVNHENSFDKLTRLVKNVLNRLASNIVTIPATVFGFDSTIPVPQALKFIRVNEDNDGFDLVDQSSIATAVGFQNRYSEVFVNGVDYTAGATTTLTLTNNAGVIQNIDIYFNGAYQNKDSYTYDISNKLITFLVAIPVDVENIEINYGTALAVTGDASSYNVGTDLDQISLNSDLKNTVPSSSLIGTAVMDGNNYVFSLLTGELPPLVAGLVIEFDAPASSNPSSFAVEYDGNFSGINWANNTGLVSGDLNQTYNKRLILKYDGSNFLIISTVVNETWERTPEGWQRCRGEFSYDFSTLTDETITIPKAYIDDTFVASIQFGTTTNTAVRDAYVGTATLNRDTTSFKIFNRVTAASTRTIDWCTNGRWF